MRSTSSAKNGHADVVVYPDSGQLSFGIAHGNVREPMSFFELRGRITPTEYWDGEDLEGKSGG